MLERRMMVCSTMLFLFGLACGDDAVVCTEPPFSEDDAGLTLTRLVLDCEPGGDVLTPAVTATHPDGDSGLIDVEQTLRLCVDVDCTDTSVVWTDDLAGSGVEEYFGSANADPTPELVDEICANDVWPVKVELTDTGGYTINNVICAQVTDNR